MTALLEQQRARRTRTPSRADCPADWHRTSSAARRRGCVCEEAVAAYRAELAGRRVPAELRKRPPGNPHPTGPRNRAGADDPAPDPVTVAFLVAGYTFAGVPPTRTEYRVAAERLLDKGDRTVADVALWLGLPYDTVMRWNAVRRERQATDRSPVPIKTGPGLP